MNESSHSNANFIDSTRRGTLVGDHIEKKSRKRLADERAQLKTGQLDSGDQTPKHKPYFDQNEDDWFVDAEEDEELMDMMLQKHGFKRSNTDSILLCPGCFVTLCDLCQQHEIYETQYRAMIVSPEVRVSKAELRPWKDGDGIEYEYWGVFCRSCNAEVGVYDPKEEVYHFHDVLPSR